MAASRRLNYNPDPPPPLAPKLAWEAKCGKFPLGTDGLQNPVALLICAARLSARTPVKLGRKLSSG